jgi:hypothetical protein
MSPAVQSLAALVLVGLAASWLVLRAYAKKKSSRCGGDCGCSTPDPKLRPPAH